MNSGQPKTSSFSALLCLFLVIILGAGELTPTWGLPEQTGDLNEDGRLTIKDVAFLVNHLRGTAPLPSEVALFADVNRDGALTKSDSTRLAKAAVDLVTVPTIDLKAQDSDYDGRNDAQEIEDGTDPLDPDSVEFVRLGHWKFDEASMVGETGQMPLENVGTTNVPSFAGLALAHKPSEPKSILRYRDVEPNGSPNFNLRNGAFRFWFKPNWGSGEGPGETARLLTVGESAQDASQGFWGVSINASGNEIRFVSQAGGKEKKHVVAPIDWEANRWHKILVTYTPTFTAIEVDDERLPNAGNGMTVVPSKSVRESDGLTIGSARDGTKPAKGAFEELETFNYRPGGDIDKYSHDFTLSASIQSSPETIRLDWKGIPGDPVLIERRPVGERNWSVLARNYHQWSYTNAPAAIKPTTRYEFRIRREEANLDEQKSTTDELFDRYVVSRVEPEVIHERGRALVLVDETVAPELSAELDRLKRDLVGDGWLVTRHQVPRHDDQNWENNIPKIREIKALVESEYQKNPESLRAVFLIGHVPIPQSGQFRPDGHHDRPWPVDFYYGDTVMPPRETVTDNDPAGAFYETSSDFHVPGPQITEDFNVLANDVRWIKVDNVQPFRADRQISILELRGLAIDGSESNVNVEAVTKRALNGESYLKVEFLKDLGSIDVSESQGVKVVRIHWSDVLEHEGIKDRLRGIPPVPNVPSDGIFDQRRFPSSIEVAVGRVDFANLPTFTETPPDGVALISEIDLLKRYLDKNHRYRQHKLRFRDKVASLGFFGGSLGVDPNRLLYSYALKNVSAWFGLEPTRIRQVNHFKTQGNYLWGFQFGAGFYDAIGVGNKSHSHTTADFADPSKAPNTGFYVLDGSFFGEWNTEDNLLRASLAPTGSGLAALWGRWFKQRWQSMAWGDSLGKSVVKTINGLDTRDFVLFDWSNGYNIHIALIGDPTLRLYVDSPPTGLVAEAEGGDVSLSWDGPPSPQVGYFVYRSVNGLEGPFELLTEEALAGTGFTDEAAPDGAKLYQVRGVRDEVTGSGVFRNLSQAAYASVE